MSIRVTSAIMLVLGWVLAACAPARTQSPTVLPPTVESTVTSAPAPSPTVTPIPLPRLTLEQGDLYFTLEGVQRAIFSRNLAGYQVSQYTQQLDLTRQGGSLLVRLQLDSLGMGYTNTGLLDETWLRKCWTTRGRTGYTSCPCSRAGSTGTTARRITATPPGTLIL
jgi:hypothetical protein